MGLIFLYLLEDYAKNTALNFLIVNELDVGSHSTINLSEISQTTFAPPAMKYAFKIIIFKMKKTRPRFLNVEDAWEWCLDNWVKRDRQTNCLV